MLKGGGCLGCMEISFPPGTRRGEVASLHTNEFVPWLVSPVISVPPSGEMRQTGTSKITGQMKVAWAAALGFKRVLLSPVLSFLIPPTRTA